MKTLKQFGFNLLVLAGAALILWGLSGTVSAFTLVSAPSDEMTPGEVEVQAPEVLSPVQPAINLAPVPTLVEPDIDLPSENTPPVSAESIPTKQNLALIPDRIVIPSIQLDAPVESALQRKIAIGEDVFGQWLAPDEFAVGWHTDTAKLGQVGNTVLNGHHNSHGEVFARLIEVKTGDDFEVHSGDHVFVYRVTNIMILPERDVDFSRRLENSRWISPTEDERVTIISCWPKVSNTHRLLVVARPLTNYEIESATTDH